MDADPVEKHKSSANGDVSSIGYSQVPIALVGSACRLPGRCSTPHALWDFISKGQVAGNEVPPSRFSLTGNYDGSGKPGTIRSPGAMFLEDVDIAHFDASFFSISPGEAASMDPQQRLLLEVTYECLENCGLTLQNIKGGRIGCLVGSNTSGMHNNYNPVN